MDPKAQQPEAPSIGTPPIPPPPIQETVVVPPQSVGPAGNSFTPQGMPLRGLSGSGQVRSGSQLPRRIITIFAFLFLLFFIVGGIWFAWSFLVGAKEVTITYWGLWEEESVMRAAIADFETKYPKIKVSYVKQSHKQYRERLSAAINREEGPDIFRFHNTWVPMLQNDLAPIPKTVMSPSEFSSTFYPVMSSDLVAGSTIYGLPLMVDGLGLYINEDIFARKNATPPSTWEEVLNLIPVLTERIDTTITQSAIALGTTKNVEHFSDILALMFIQNGATLANPVGKEAEEALVFYRKFADPNDPVYTWNETLDNSIYAFATGKVAMILAPSWRALEIKEVNQSLKFRIIPVPQLPGSTISWASYWVEGVSAKSPYQVQAWEFIKYLTGKEGAARLYTEGSKDRLFGEPYARIDLGKTVQDDQYIGAYVRQATNARSFPLASRTFDNGLNDRLIKYFENAINEFTNGVAPSAALTTAAAGFRQVLSSFGLTSGSAPTAQ